MTEEMVCKKGKCRYTKEELNDDCPECDEAEIIENELVR